MACRKKGSASRPSRKYRANVYSRYAWKSARGVMSSSSSYVPCCAWSLCISRCNTSAATPSLPGSGLSQMRSKLRQVASGGLIDVWSICVGCKNRGRS